MSAKPKLSPVAALPRAAPRYVLYARTSSDTQRREETIQTQLSTAKQWAASTGHELRARYLDDGVSGTVPFGERAAGAQLINDARAAKFTHVLVYDYSRLGRAALDVLQIADILERLNISIISVQEPMPTGGDAGTGTLLRTLLSGVAQFGRDTFRRNSLAGKERAAREGKWMGGRPPYGYRIEQKRLVIYEPEAELVREIFRLYTSGAHALRPLAQLLNARGTPSPNSRRAAEPYSRWEFSTLTVLLRNRTYTGKYYWRKRAPDAEGRWRIADDDSNQVLIEIPPIVSEKEFAEAAATLRRNLIQASRNALRTNVLRGLIRCAVCDRTFVGATIRDAKKDLRRNYYRCYSVYAAVGACGNMQVQAQALEEEVWQWCVERIRNPDQTISEMRALLEPAPDAEAKDASVEAARIQSLLVEKERARAKLIRMVAADTIDEREGVAPLNELRAEEVALEQARDKLEEEAARRSQVGSHLTEMRRMLLTLQRKVHTDDPLKRRDIIASLVSHVVVERLLPKGVKRGGNGSAANARVEIHLKVY